MCFISCEWKMDRVVTWLCIPETHQFNNCVAVTLLCDTDHQGALWLHDVLRRLGDVETLRGKPRLLLYQSCGDGEVTGEF